MGFGAVLGDLGSAVIGGLFGQHSADKQMDFQRHMSNTAHRREVRDLKAAGLNPILSAGGPGAVTPSGASSSMSVNPLGTSYSNAASAKVARETAELEQDLLRAQVDKTKAETLNTGQDYLLKGLDQQLKQFDLGNLPSLHASARASEASTRSLQAKQIEEITQLMKADAANRELQDWGGEALKKLREGATLDFSDLLGLGGTAFKQVLDALLPSGKAVYGRGVRR